MSIEKRNEPDPIIEILPPERGTSPYRAPGLLEVLTDTVNTMKEVRLSDNQVARTNAQTRQIDAETRQFQAQATGAMEKLTAEIELYRLTMARDRAKRNYMLREVATTLSPELAVKVIDEETLRQQALTRLAIAQAQETAVRSGKADPFAIPGTSPVALPPHALEPATTPDELSKIALNLWAETRSLDQDERREALSAAWERLGDRMPAYDVASVIRQVEELTRKMG